MVIWIIGLSGSGKTTLANDIFRHARKQKSNIVLIDGDIIRDLFNNDLGYTKSDRRKNSERISKLCKFLNDQKIHVLCSILSLFPESRIWNRKNISDYYQVYIESSIESLQKRDPKGIYKRYNEGKIKNVAGKDIKFITPENSDLIIKNDGGIKDLLSYSKQLSELLK